ncbi:MAG: hydroxymethylbilane synthase [Planctomycetota bacterium]
MTQPLRIATRRSKLALWQAEHVATRLRGAHAGLEVQLVPMTTRGDQIQDRSLAAIGGKGLFIKELEVALEEGRADIAVHSMKDVPAELPPGMTLGAILARADTRDALISRRFAGLDDLPRGARVGTSSLRRQAQLLAKRPDLAILPLRGNVDTRLRKLDEGELDAIVLASAGLIRLGWEARITEMLDPTACLPAVGQGAIGVECREGDEATLARLAALEHAPTRIAVSAERAFSHRLGGSCQSPVAAFARLEQGVLQLTGLVAEPDGSRLWRDSVSGAPGDAQSLGMKLADGILAQGAKALLERLAH